MLFYYDYRITQLQIVMKEVMVIMFQLTELVVDWYMMVMVVIILRIVIQMVIIESIQKLKGTTFSWVKEKR